MTQEPTLASALKASLAFAAISRALRVAGFNPGDERGFDLATQAYELGAKAERQRIRDLADAYGAEYASGTEPCGCSREDCEAERIVLAPFAGLLDGDGDE